MSAMSDYLENKLVDHIFRGVSFPVQGTLWFALFTGAPSDAAGSGTEVSGAGYARVSKTCDFTNFSPTQSTNAVAANSNGTTGSTQNKTVIQFGTPGVGGWGSVSHFGIFDASTGGNLLFHGALTGGSRTIQQNDTVSFPVDSLQITLA